MHLFTLTSITQNKGKQSNYGGRMGWGEADGEEEEGSVEKTEKLGRVRGKRARG